MEIGSDSEDAEDVAEDAGAAEPVYVFRETSESAGGAKWRNIGL